MCSKLLSYDAVQIIFKISNNIIIKQQSMQTLHTLITVRKSFHSVVGCQETAHILDHRAHFKNIPDRTLGHAKE